MYRRGIVIFSPWARAKAGVTHSWEWFKNGSLLFRKNFAISKKLLKKKLNGEELSYKEHQVLVTTSSDIAKLIPFSFFVIVPFAELLLPVVVRFYPKILPSTYDVNKLLGKEVGSTGESQRSKKFQARQELIEFFKEVSLKTDSDNEAIAKAKSRNEAINEFKQLLINSSLGDRKVLPDIEAIQKFVTHFSTDDKNYFKLENLKIEVLESICYLLNIDPFGFRSHVIIQLKRFINEIRREDKSIQWEGVNSLTQEELVEANRKRGLPIDNTTSDDLRVQLKEWIELSSNKDIPISLLLWIRAFAYSENLDLLDLAPVVTDPAAPKETYDRFSSSTRLKEISEDMIRRINELDNIEKELDESTPDHIEEKIKLLKHQLDVISKELNHLHKLRRIRQRSSSKIVRS
jgi:LETM1 and EF-hand domain-containing protein 1, mitochondrial